MANSKDNKNEVSSSDFAGDLDSMLNDAELSMDGQGDFIDDEDAIDKLLMDDSFDESSDSDKVESDDSSQIDDLLNDEFGEDLVDDAKENESSDDEFAADESVDEEQIDDLLNDEFGEDSDDVAKAHNVSDDDFGADENTDENQIDDLLNDEFGEDAVVNAEENNLSDDEFGADEFNEEDNKDSESLEAAQVDNNSENIEVDDFMSDGDIFGEVDDNIEQASKDSMAEINELGEDAEESDDDDFLMADFDISADDEFEEDDAELSMDDDEPEMDVAPPEVVENKVEAVATPPPVQIDPAEIESLNAQISQLWAENENIKQQVTEIVAASSHSEDDLISTEIESLQKEQRKFKKLLFESQSKVPVITYVAMGIAILALLVGSILGAIGYGAQSDVESLSELVLTLEEELEILAAKDLTKDFKKINLKIKNKYDDLNSKNKKLNKEIALLSKQLKTNPLKAVVDDLVEQNNHAQEAIESLLVKVDELEKRKFSSAVARKSKKIKAKPKVHWIVNLVSYKQEWYARRKVLEFKKKGIAAVVKKVKIDGDTWFRLSVKGFKSQYEAAAYAVKVKKVLNLTEVWVAKL